MITSLIGVTVNIIIIDLVDVVAIYIYSTVDYNLSKANYALHL